MNLSLSGFLFEQDYNAQTVDFPTFCSIAKSSGYAGVELRRTQVSTETPAEQRRTLLRIVKDHGLRVTCLTARGLPEGGPERDACFRKLLDLCADMECGLMKIGSDAQWCRAAAARAAQVGVTLACNNHRGGPLQTVRGTLEFFEEVKHANFGLLYDCMHLMVGGEDYVGCIPEVAGLTKNILVQSQRRVRPGDEDNGVRECIQALPDEEGVQDWQRVFAAFRREGYDGLITVIENGWPEELREDVARLCAKAIRDLWNA